MPVVLRSPKYLPEELSESPKGPWPTSRGRREKGKERKRQVRARMTSSSPEPLLCSWKAPWPQPGQDHTLDHTSWTSGLDKLQPPARGISSQLGLYLPEHTCALVHHLPKCKQGWRELSQHLTLRQKGKTHHTQLEGGARQMLTKTSEVHQREGLSLIVQIRNLRPSHRVICSRPPCRDRTRA